MVNNRDVKNSYQYNAYYSTGSPTIDEQRGTIVESLLKTSHFIKVYWQNSYDHELK